MLFKPFKERVRRQINVPSDWKIHSTETHDSFTKDNKEVWVDYDDLCVHAIINDDAVKHFQYSWNEPYWSTSKADAMAGRINRYFNYLEGMDEKITKEKMIELYYKRIKLARSIESKLLNNKNTKEIVRRWDNIVFDKNCQNECLYNRLRNEYPSLTKDEALFIAFNKEILEVME